MTTEHDPGLLRQYADETATCSSRVGLDRATLFRQSHVPAHAQLAYLLECVATTGELNRMIQFKEKGRGVDSTRVSLFTYPALMAADILLYRPEQVPGRRRPAPARRADPRPRAALQPALRRGVHGPRGRHRRRRHRPGDGPAAPDRKMSKSADAAGSIYLLDPPDVVRRKVARAVTDSDTGPDAVRADRAAKPGRDQPARRSSTACGGSADGLTTYGALKAAVTDAVVADAGADPEAVRRARRRPGARRPRSTPPAPPAAARSPRRCWPRRPGRDRAGVRAARRRWVHHGMSSSRRFPRRAQHGKGWLACIPW